LSAEEKRNLEDGIKSLENALDAAQSGKSLAAEDLGKIQRAITSSSILPPEVTAEEIAPADAAKKAKKEAKWKEDAAKASHAREALKWDELLHSLEANDGKDVDPSTCQEFLRVFADVEDCLKTPEMVAFAKSLREKLEEHEKNPETKISLTASDMAAIGGCVKVKKQ